MISLPSIIVTVTDENPTNQNALRIFVRSASNNSRMLSRIHVLHPKTINPMALFEELDKKGVTRHAYRYIQTDDKYAVKFMLVDFINTISDPNFTVLYLDPDHIVLHDVEIHNKPFSIQVSSETKLSEYNVPILKGVHYNTSLIFGRVADWKLASMQWANFYEQLQGTVPDRFREEVAFAAAALNSDVTIEPVSSMIQSHTEANFIESSLFHYGGESNISKEVKRLLKYPLSQIRADAFNCQANTKTNTIKWLFTQTMQYLL